MFDILRRKSKDVAPERKLRGVLPTFVSDELVVLSKASPTIRNTYEIRLALYMAVSRKLRFILAVKPQTVVDPVVTSLLKEHGAQLQEAQLEDFCVYFGHASPNGDESGWVLGDAAALHQLQNSVRSAWLRERLVPGHVFPCEELDILCSDLGKEHISVLNIDGENVGQALLQLATAARRESGSVFIE
jgi:hypothetical protein